MKLSNFYSSEKQNLPPVAQVEVQLAALLAVLLRMPLNSIEVRCRCTLLFALLAV